MHLFRARLKAIFRFASIPHMRLPIPKFKVLLYGPGLPAAGLKARAHFEASVLVVEGKGHWFTIQGDRLSLKTGGFDGRQWLLFWYTPTGAITAMLQGDDAAEAFIKLAPPAVSEELGRMRIAHGEGGHRSRWRLALLVLAIFVLLLILGVFSIHASSPRQVSVNRDVHGQGNQPDERMLK
jgi:hypothetical protein